MTEQQRLGVVTDIHLDTENRTSIRSSLQTMISRFNDEFRPHRTVILGDLIQDSESAEADRDNVKYLIESFSDLTCPITYLIGNHDVQNLSPSTLEAILDQKTWGTIADVGGVYLDSSAPHVPGAAGAVTPAQLEFLTQGDIAPKSSLMFVHHPIHYHDIRSNYWFGTSPERAFCVNKNDIHPIVEDLGIAGVFNGHLHESNHTTVNGVHHFTINAFNREFPNAEITGTFAEITVDENLGVRIVEGDRLEQSWRIPIA